MSDVWNALAGEIFDVASTVDAVRYGVRLIVAALLGGALGYERQYHHKRAGLRTHMLVALGSAVFVLVPMQAKMDDAALSRVIQGLVVGIGFIGGGTILHLRDRSEIKGLTTAAGIWLTAAIGMAVGLGRIGTAVLTTILALVILAVLPRLERRMPVDDNPEPGCVQPEPTHGTKE